MAWQSSQICGLQYGKSSCCVTPKHPKVLLPEISWFEMHSSLTSEKKSCQKEIPTPLFSVQTDAISVIRCLHVSRLSIKVPAKKQEQRPLVFTRCDHITRRRTSFKSWKAFADIVLLQWTDFFSPVLGFWWCVMFIALRFKIIWDIKVRLVVRTLQQSLLPDAIKCSNEQGNLKTKALRGWWFNLLNSMHKI